MLRLIGGVNEADFFSSPSSCLGMSGSSGSCSETVLPALSSQAGAWEEDDGTITADELIKYINDQNDGLPYYSNRLYQRPQEAQLEGNGQTVIERIEK